MSPLDSSSDSVLVSIRLIRKISNNELINQVPKNVHLFKNVAVSLILRQCQ